MAKFTYLKPVQEVSPYYVHVTLDEAQHTMTVYYHMGWWRKAAVDRALFAFWIRLLRDFAGSKKLGRKSVQFKANVAKVKASKVKVHRRCLQDLFGFVEPSVPLYVTAHRMLGYVSAVDNIVEFTFKFRTDSIGPEMTASIAKLPIFTETKDAEYVISRLPYFNPSHLKAVGAVDTSNYPEHRSHPKYSNQLHGPAADQKTGRFPQVAQSWFPDPLFDGKRHPYVPNNCARAGGDPAQPAQAPAGDDQPAAVDD